MLKIVHVPGLIYEGETLEEAAERDRKIEEFNERVEREIQAWDPAPMKLYESWCREHAPELLEPGGLKRMREQARK